VPHGAAHAHIAVLQPEKGGDPQVVKDSQAKRFAPPELVDEVLALYKDWVATEYELQQVQKDLNAIKRDIGAKMKAKADASEELKQKAALDARVAELKPEVVKKEQTMRFKAGRIGNIVGDMVPISATEVSAGKRWQARAARSGEKRREASSGICGSCRPVPPIEALAIELLAELSRERPACGVVGAGGRLRSAEPLC
jgi:seryl-tRNA synthetase